MSSRRAAFSGLNENTLPMMEAVRLAIEPGLEQDEIIGDVAEVLRRAARHRFDPVGLAAILVGGGQPVGPHHGPGGGRAFAGHSRGGLDRVHAFLRRDAEQREDIGVLGLIVAVPIAHLCIFQHAGLVAFLALDFGLCACLPCCSLNCLSGGLRPVSCGSREPLA